MDEGEYLCESLVRHVETSGSDVYERNYEQAGRITCTVWCVLGSDAEKFALMAREWMRENGYVIDR